MPNAITLLAENLQLKKQLEVAQAWMQKSVAEQRNIIAKEKVSTETCSNKNTFFHDNVTEIINKKIQEFFGEIMLVKIPTRIIKNIVSAEITYYNFRQHTDRDGFAVISSYHKALDIIIEEFITSEFRSYIDIKRLPKDLENDPLNKSLYNIVHKNYTLSVGRLFHIVQLYNESLKNKEHYPIYTHLFFGFIKQNYNLKILFADEDFSKTFTLLMNSEVLGSKRHSGNISFVETREARKQLIGEFKDPHCLIYKLISLGQVD